MALESVASMREKPFGMEAAPKAMPNAVMPGISGSIARAPSAMPAKVRGAGGGLVIWSGAINSR